MSIDRGTDREDEVIYTMENYSSIENNETMPSVATWVDLEIHAKSVRERQVWYHLYVESKVWHKGTYLQTRNKLINFKLVITKGEQWGRNTLGVWD